MSFQHSIHGRQLQAERAAAAASASAAPSVSAAPYFLSAVHGAGTSRPSYIDFASRSCTAVPAPALRSPLSLSTSTPSSSAAGAPCPPRALLLPHMDDMDEEIQALGYEKAMVAGAAAGVVEHVFMFPVDTIKTRMQALQTGGPRYRHVFDALARIPREEGVRRLYRGFNATVAGAIPSHAVHYATYEHIRHRAGGLEPGHHPVINGMAGGMATMAHDAIVTPLDVVKQRLQVYNSSYTGVLQCIRTVFVQEGLRAFYASYPTTVAMNVPFQAVHFAAYESFKIFATADEHEHGFMEELTAGGAAGALAGFVSTPLDVVKTRLQTQQVPSGEKRLGTLEMVRLIARSDGARGFMRGATARVLYYIPSAAICWTTYEAMKRLLKDAW